MLPAHLLLLALMLGLAGLVPRFRLRCHRSGIHVRTVCMLVLLLLLIALLGAIFFSPPLLETHHGLAASDVRLEMRRCHACLTTLAEVHAVHILRGHILIHDWTWLWADLLFT